MKHLVTPAVDMLWIPIRLVMICVLGVIDEDDW